MYVTSAGIARLRRQVVKSAAPAILIGTTLFFNGCSGRNSTSVTAKVLAVEKSPQSNTSTPPLRVGQNFSAGETCRLSQGQEATMAFTPAVMAQLLGEARIVITKLRLGRDGNETGYETMEREIEIRCLMGSIIGSVSADALKTHFVITTDAGSLSVEPGSLFYLTVSGQALQVSCPRGMVRLTTANRSDVVTVPSGKWLAYQKGATSQLEPQAAFENARAQQEVTLALEAEATMQPLLAAEQRAVPSWRHL